MQKHIIKTIAFFVIAFGCISLVTTQIITMENYVGNIAFFVLCVTIILLRFKTIYINIIKELDKSSLLLVIASLVIHVFSAYFMLNFLDYPDLPFSNEGVSFLLMNSFYIFAKPFDVLIQHLLITMLVTKLRTYKMSLKHITLLFIVFFGGIHIFQIFKTDIVIGLGFTAVALIFSVIFPYMILKVKNGVIYNYIIHLGTYNIAALLVWLIY